MTDLTTKYLGYEDLWPWEPPPVTFRIAACRFNAACKPVQDVE